MSDRRPKRRTVLWTIQGLLAVLFLFAGGAKLVPSAAEMAAQSSLPVGFLRFIGVCEVLGGFGLVLPSLTGIRPELTSWAAAGLVVIMIGAIVITTLEMGAAQALFPLSVAVLTAYVGYRRAARKPRSLETGVSG